MTQTLNAALAELQTQLPHISKDLIAKVKSERTGAQYQYSYADLAQISREVLPLLGKLGLAFTTRPTVEDGKFVLVYELRHTSGEVIAGVYPLQERGTPQEIGGAITYARRYCLCAVTGVAPDDDDNDAVEAERAAKREQRKRREPTTQAPKESPINGEQLRRLSAAFREAEITSREAMMAYASGVADRPLGAATELTHVEAERVITVLSKDVAAKRTPETAVEPGDWPATAQPPAGE